MAVSFPARLRFGAGLPASTWTSRRGGVVSELLSGLSLSGSEFWSNNSEEVEMIIGDPRRMGIFRSASRRADEEDRPAKEAVSSLDVRLADVLDLSLLERPFTLPGALAEVAAFD